MDWNYHQSTSLRCDVPHRGISFLTQHHNSQIHPFGQQKPIVEWCRKRGILMQAYCAILRGAMDHPVIQDIAKKVRQPSASTGWFLSN